MEWLKERVWQLGIGILLAVIGTILMYLGGTPEQDRIMIWIGLILFFIAMLIPLFAKVFERLQEERGEEGET
jgi:uncharacterized membrane protein YhhN